MTDPSQHPSALPFHQHGLFPRLALSVENTTSADLDTGGRLLRSHYTPYSASCVDISARLIYQSLFANFESFGINR